MEPEFVLDNYSRLWQWKSGKLRYFMADETDPHGLTFNQLHESRGPLFQLAKGKETIPIPIYQKGEFVEFNISESGPEIYATVVSFDEAKQIYVLEVRISRDKVKKSP